MGLYVPVATLSVYAVPSPPASRMRSFSARLGVLLVLLALGAHSRAALGAGRSADPAAAPPASAESPVRGVVWTPPASPDSALHELARIDRLGATAVRLTRLPSDTVAARAAALDLALYVDLPVRYVPAARLGDALQAAAPSLARLRTLARRHASITHVGLAHGAATTAPGACAALRRWTARVHGWTRPLRTYYVTPFPPGADRCAPSVDRVLLDVRGHPAPAEHWRDWRSQTTPVGIGAVGTWVWPSAPSGLRSPHSPERQARYLEGTLSRLLDSTRASSPVLFVSHWRDRTDRVLSTRRYGLHEASGPPRPAAAVVRGFYTGTQRVFAFPAGFAPRTAPYVLLLLGWGLFGLLGALYARSLFVRQTVARYFTAPGFYRDALRDGTDLHPGANALLLGIVAGALGITGVRVAQMAGVHLATEHVLAALPPPVQGVLSSGIAQPAWAGLMLGGLALVLLGIWGGTLVLMARWRSSFALAQGLVLVAWPCWPALLALPLALAAGPTAPLSPSLLGLLLLGGCPLACAYVSGRVLYDYWVVTDLSGATVLLLGLFSPLGLAAAGGLALAMGAGVSFSFLWELATLTG